MTEIWKSIPGYDGFYQASTGGRIRSIDRMIRGKNKKIVLRKGKILKPTISRCGYERVTLCRPGSKKIHSVHKLVLLAFIGSCPEGMECAHEDGRRTNNKILNLSWKTPSQNQEDRIKHGTDDQGFKSARAKFTTKQVLDIRSRYRPYSKLNGMAALAREYSVCTTTIQNILIRRSWRNV